MPEVNQLELFVGDPERSVVQWSNLQDPEKWTGFENAFEIRPIHRRQKCKQCRKCLFDWWYYSLRIACSSCQLVVNG